MVFTGKIDPQTKAFVKFLRENDRVSVKEISKGCRILRASVYVMTSKKKSPGRPRKIAPREERSESFTEMCNNYATHKALLR